MKLRNKKTGLIGELHFEPEKEYHFTVVTEDPADVMIHKTIADLYVEWEDYEEPKDFWYIDDFAIMCGVEGEFTKPELGTFTKKDIKNLIEIGNCFETFKEADEVLEKLKAWKRLKDNCGISFSRLKMDRKGRPVSVNLEFNKEGRATFDEAVQNVKDLTLLFGGEE